MPISRLPRIASRLISFAAMSAALSLSPALAEEPVNLLPKNLNSEAVFDKFFDFQKEGKEEEAVDVLRFAAQAGNPAAQWKLGRMYQTGDGVKQNPWEAFSFFKSLTESNPNPIPNTPNWLFSANAFVALGHYYRDGIAGTSVEPDPNQARVMFTTAAFVFGHPDAQFELGKMDLQNATTRYTARRAINMLRRAQNQGHVGAQALVGKILFEGEFASRDAVRGLMLLTDAKERAPLDQREWISGMQEEAFALASETERRSALAALQASK